MSSKRKKKIQDFNLIYCVTRIFVDTLIRLSYRKILFVGKENIPSDGAIIYAPNHTNALMDALVVLGINRKPKVFVARADIFKNRRLAKIFSFLKIMPIMRQRDGFKEVKKNQETIDKAVDVLNDQIPFCIFPEGTHQSKYSLLPLSKGIFRIAFHAHELNPNMPLYIVPTGLVYGDFFRFRSTLRVQIGEPINVGHFIDEHAELTSQEQMNAMKDLLENRLQSCITYIPNDADYQASYEISKIAQPYEIQKLLIEEANSKKTHLELQFEANNHTLKRIAELKKSDPEQAAELFKLANKAYILREAKHISIDSVSSRTSILSYMIKAFVVLVTLPYSLTVSVFTIPKVLICKYLISLLKDPAFRNSARYLVLLLIWPIFMLIYGITAFSIFSWTWALLIILFILPAPIVAHEICRAFRISISDIKLSSEKELKKIHAQITDILIK